MADRSAKRLRRLSTDYDESDATDDWRDKGQNSNAPSAPPPTASSTRPRRNTASRAPPAAVIQPSPGKLREATGGRAATQVSSRNIVSGKRARNSRVVREVDSDDEDEDEDEDEAEEVDAMDVDDDEDDVDAEGDEDEEVDAEGEEDDEMEVTPAPRIAVPSNKSVPVKQKVAQDSVEAKEMTLDDDDDEELSELASELEGEDEDAEGEDEDAEGDEDDDIAVPNDDEEEMDSDEDLSRDQTPDLSKMTRRQQAMVVQGADDGLMALSNEAQKKKHLTAEEITSRRAEMARRRKNLSEKRNEEEKMDTINRLLKKQPPKRGRKAVAQEDTESGQQEDEKKEPEKINPIFIRYKQNRDGASLSVPEEWLQAPAGNFFNGTLARPISRPYSGRMVEEVS